MDDRHSFHFLRDPQPRVPRQWDGTCISADDLDRLTDGEPEPDWVHRLIDRLRGRRT